MLENMNGCYMKKLLVLGFTLFIGSQVWAARVLPSDIRLAVLKQVNYPDIVLAGDGWSWTQILTLGLLGSNRTETEALESIRIKDAHNRFITKNRLQGYVGQPVGVFLNHQNQVREVWILTPSEYEQLKKRGRD